MGKSTINGKFSIATLVYQRVNNMNPHPNNTKHTQKPTIDDISYIYLSEKIEFVNWPPFIIDNISYIYLNNPSYWSSKTFFLLNPIKSNYIHLIKLPLKPTQHPSNHQVCWHRRDPPRPLTLDPLWRPSLWCGYLWRGLTFKKTLWFSYWTSMVSNGFWVCLILTLW